jgi:hypothetical protein
MRRLDGMHGRIKAEDALHKGNNWPNEGIIDVTQVSREDGDGGFDVPKPEINVYLHLGGIVASVAFH